MDSYCGMIFNMLNELIFACRIQADRIAEVNIKIREMYPYMNSTDYIVITKETKMRDSSL